MCKSYGWSFRASYFLWLKGWSEGLLCPGDSELGAVLCIGPKCFYSLVDAADSLDRLSCCRAQGMCGHRENRPSVVQTSSTHAPWGVEFLHGNEIKVILRLGISFRVWGLSNLNTIWDYGGVKKSQSNLNCVNDNITKNKAVLLINKQNIINPDQDHS